MAKRSKVEKSTSIIQTIGITVLIVVAVVAMAALGYTGYYWKVNDTSTVKTFYQDRLTYAEDETYFAEINYYSNELNNGIEIFEVRLNYYTDVLTPDENSFKIVYSSGVQFVGVPQFKKNIEVIGRYGFWNIGQIGAEKTAMSGEHYFYNTTNETSYTAVSKLNIQDEWIVDFGGSIAKIKTKGVPTALNDKKQPVYDDKYKIMENIAARLYPYFDINHFIETMYASVKGSRNGYDVLIYDLSQWFIGHSFDGEKFHDEADADQNYMFMNVKVNRIPLTQQSFR